MSPATPADKTKRRRMARSRVSYMEPIILVTMRRAARNGYVSRT
jgi:hypothetical protein